MSDVSAVFRTRQPSRRDESFAARFAVALNGRDKAWLAREAGFSTSTVHDYSRGVMPSADRVFRLAAALGVDAAWLVTGEGVCDPADMVSLPIRALSGLTPGEPWSPAGAARAPRQWFEHGFGGADGLWATQAPSDVAPEVGRRGDPILCRDPVEPLEAGALYLVELADGPVLRRLMSGPDGPYLGLEADQAAPIAPPAAGRVEAPRVLGRVVGRLAAPL